LVTNNSRFLILPDRHFPNLDSRILSLCQNRLPADWQALFGHRVVLLETFVDPQRFAGTIYKAANWIYVGDTKGFHRTRQGYSNTAQSLKMVFVKPLKSNAQTLLSRPILKPAYRIGGRKIMLSAQQMQSLPNLFADIPDPRRGQGRRHRLSTILAIAAGATLCGMYGYLAISDWTKNLSQSARKRNAHYHFTVKNNQPGLFQDIALYFEDRQEPDFVLCDPPDHGRIEIRKIWTNTELNGYLNFPHVRQAFVIQREFTDKKTGENSCEIAYGITSRTPEQADPQRVLAANRGHWSIENSCHYIIDWNYHEDRSRIRTGYGPENITRLRRFAISIIKIQRGT
jgi:predicted transposase YbfD/YdcC